MEVKWLWLSYVVDPLIIVLLGSIGVWLNSFVNAENKDTFKRASTYMLKAVALTAAVVGITAFRAVFTAGEDGQSMILLAFCTIVLGTALGAWTNFDERLEEWIDNRWDSAKKIESTNKFVNFFVKLDAKKQEPEKTFGWAAAYATYVSIVGVLSIMGPIHEATDGVLTFIIMKCVLDAVATFVFAINWGPGVILSAGFVLVWQLMWGLAAPYLATILPVQAINFADGVGGMIIMCMGLSVAGVLKETTKKDFRTGNMFPAMVLAFIVGAIAVALNFYW